jgi:hypothetical protein
VFTGVVTRRRRGSWSRLRWWRWVEGQRSRRRSTVVRRVRLRRLLEAQVRRVIVGGQGGEFAVSPFAGIVEIGVRFLVEFCPRDGITPLAAVLEPEQTEADTGQAGPDPPPAACVVQLVTTECQYDERECP